MFRTVVPADRVNTCLLDHFVCVLLIGKYCTRDRSNPELLVLQSRSRHEGSCHVRNSFRCVDKWHSITVTVIQS